MKWKGVARRIVSSLVCFMLVISMVQVHTAAASQGFVLKTNASAYAKQFVTDSEGQQWFIQEIERLLNIQEKSLNTIKGQQDLQDIVTLGFYKQGIEGKLPKAIGELSHLRYLFLGSNQLEGALPAELFKLSQLEKLDLSDNKLNGSLPKDIEKLQHLQTLLLHHNGFSHALPEELGKLTKLQNLDLAGNRFTGQVPNLSKLTLLKLLALSGNLFDEQPLPGWLDELTELEVLMLWNNRFTGALPASVSKLTKLKVLDISQNKLTGSLPDEWSALTKLERLAAHENQLTGELQDSYRSWGNLTVLDLSHNALEGSIPPSYENLKKLQVFDVSQNKLQGTIPAIWKDMPLKVADFSYNQLTGHVPSELASKERAGTQVYIAYNYLTGAAAAGIKKNTDNFIDGVTQGQLRLELPASIRLNVDEKINIYEQFKTLEARNGKIAVKPKLQPSAYQLILHGIDDDDADDFIELSQDSKGLYIKLLQELPFQEGAAIELAIKDNTGSAYSRTKAKIGSDVPPTTGGGTPGGSGGGTTPSEPDGDEDEEELPANAKTHTRYLYGYADGSIRPDALLTREEVAVMLHRITEQGGGKAPYPITFTDVAEDRWSAKAIEVVSGRKLMVGYPDGTFRPKAPISRAEVAVLLARWVKDAEEHEHNQPIYSDVNGSYWAADAIAKLSSTGWMKGYLDGTFRPKSWITRAEFVTAMNKALDRTPDSSAIKQLKKSPYHDLSEKHWAYAQMLEASLTHSYVAGDKEQWHKVERD